MADFGGVFGAMAGLISTDMTNRTNAQIAEANRRQQELQNNVDYGRFIENRNATWEREDAIRNELYGREDTSYQRSVADAKAAGLSPLAVNQLSSAGGNPVTSSGTPPVHTQAPASYMAQSPAQDIATLVGAIMSQKNIDELRRHNMATEEQSQRELDFQTRKTNSELLQQASQFDEQMKFEREQAATQSSQFMLTYQQNASQFTARLAQDNQFHLDDLRGKALDRALNDMHSINQQNIDSGRDFAKSLNMKYVLKYYTNDDDYNKAMSSLKNIMISGNRKVTNDIESNPEKYLSSDSAAHSESENNAVSAGAGGNKASSDNTSTVDKSGTYGKTVVDKVSNALSRGFNVNASAQKGTSEADSYSVSKSDRALAEEISKLYGSVLEIPVRVYDWNDYEKHYSKYK